jgi:hypothetical protein
VGLAHTGSSFLAIYLFIVLCGDRNTSGGKKKKQTSTIISCEFLLLGVMASLVCGSRNKLWLTKLQRPTKKNKNPAV